LRDAGVALPVRRHARLHDPAAARVPRRRQGTRARGAGGGASRAPADRAVVPELRVPDRAQLPALPAMPRAAEGSGPVVLEAARPALVGLPLLRDAGAPGAKAPPVVGAEWGGATPAAGPRRAAEAKRAAQAQAGRPRQGRRVG